MAIFAPNFYNVQISFKYRQNYCQLIFVCVEQVFSVLEHVLARGAKLCGPPCIILKFFVNMRLTKNLFVYALLFNKQEVESVSQ